MYKDVISENIWPHFDCDSVRKTSNILQLPVPISMANWWLHCTLSVSECSRLLIRRKNGFLDKATGLPVQHITYRYPKRAPRKHFKSEWASWKTIWKYFDLVSHFLKIQSINRTKIHSLNKYCGYLTNYDYAHPLPPRL